MESFIVVFSVIIFFVIFFTLILIPEVIFFMIVILLGCIVDSIRWVLGMPFTVEVGNEEWVYRWFWRIK